MGKIFGLLGLYVVVKGLISSFLINFGCLEISRGISLATNMLAFISNLEYFYSVNVFPVFHLHFHAQQWYISFLQERAVYLLSNAMGDLT